MGYCSTVGIEETTDGTVAITESTVTTKELSEDQIKVSILQVGDMKHVGEGQIEVIGTVTLVSEHGYHVVIDTGSASDSDAILQSKLLLSSKGSRQHIKMKYNLSTGNMKFYGTTVL